jgi:hypothetical protein
MLQSLNIVGGGSSTSIPGESYKQDEDNADGSANDTSSLTRQLKPSIL